ncbi:MAG: type II secretion system protein [Gammaproteobacteria bacterium]|nr:MAG: type II secretion system protein [Gammaproteobacteria bacterium]
MRTNLFFFKKMKLQDGVSLIELIVFLVVVGIASSALFAAYTNSLLHNADPIIQVRALELAQARLDEILALKYDENTPTGGIPACNSLGAALCNNTPDANKNDVDDFNNVNDVPYSSVVKGINYSYSRNVTVATADNLKLITVTVTAPRGFSVTLAAYKANF